MPGADALADMVASGPAMFDTARLDQAGGLDDLGQRAAAAGLCTATLDEVFCTLGLDPHPQLPWSAEVAGVINELIRAGAARHFAELSTGDPSPYFAAVAADSKVLMSYNSETGANLDADLLAANPPEGGYDLLFVDAWHKPKLSLDLLEQCLTRLSANGVVVVHGSNPPGAGHRRPAEEDDPGSECDGQVLRAVVDFRIRHPQCEVFTVDAGWGCTVVRPSRQSRQELALAPVDRIGGIEFERERNTLLNLVSVDWFRRHLYADPYLAGAARLTKHTEVLNALISLNDFESYLEIGVGDGANLSQIIAPIRHSVDPGARLGGAAMFPVTSDDVLCFRRRAGPLRPHLR